MKFNHNWINTLLIALVAILVWVGGNQPVALGGLTNYDEVGTTEGYEVDDSQVIDGNGNYVGAITATTITASGATSVETFTEGGGIRATSTDDTSATLLASDFDVENMIEFTPELTGITLTGPASSTLSSFVPNASDHRSLMLCNATTTAATPFTFAAGAGTNLHQATSTMAIGTGMCAVLEFYRATDTDIELYYDLGY